MKYKEVSVSWYEIGVREMREEWKWTKTIPDDNWDRKKREEKGKSDKMTPTPSRLENS